MDLPQGLASERSFLKVKTFLRIAVFIIALCTFVFMLYEPHLEGRNANATPFEIYFKDPFLAYAYFASIPFFMALYQAFKALGSTGYALVQSLRTIKHCSVAMICFALGGVTYIMLHESDDRAGGVFMGMLVTLCSVVMAIAAAKFERRMQKEIV